MESNLKREILSKLQIYLLEVFELQGKCEHSFKHTEWYLEKKLVPEQVQEFKEFLASQKVNCDCGVLTLNEPEPSI